MLRTLKRHRVAALMVALAVAAATAAVALGNLGAAADQEEPDQELEEFVPSEKLPADSAISFPADI